MGKRKYTVSAKVLAANRRNLEKARAIPKSIRYRSTERRRVACRQNLLKASATRPAATTMPRRHPARGCSLRRTARRWGEEAFEWLKAQMARVVYLIDPYGDEETKLARGIAEGLGRWVALAHERAERERQGLLRVWSSAPQDAVTTARLACRLLGLFGGEAWREKAIERLRLRLQRLARTCWLQRNLPRWAMSEALEEVMARDLGNPFRALPSPSLEALLREPDEALEVSEYLLLPELPGEEPDVSQPAVSGRKKRRAVAAVSSPPGMAMSPSPGAATFPSPDVAWAWPANFAGYRRQVKQSLGVPKAGAKLQACIERIARLSWERFRVAERESQRLEAALEKTLEEGYKHMRAEETMDAILDALAGTASQAAEAEAEKLEEELAAAFREYLCCRYGPHPAFDCVRRPAVAAMSSSPPESPCDEHTTACDPATSDDRAHPKER